MRLPSISKQICRACFIQARGDGARLVPIDDHAFQWIFAPDESTQRFIARSDGYPHDKPAVIAHVLAPTPERCDEIVAGLALLRGLQFSEAGA